MLIMHCLVLKYIMYVYMLIAVYKKHIEIYNYNIAI